MRPDFNEIVSEQPLTDSNGEGWLLVTDRLSNGGFYCHVLINKGSRIDGRPIYGSGLTETAEDAVRIAKKMLRVAATYWPSDPPNDAFDSITF